MKEAYFAGGCFWCIASVFDSTDGVTDVVSGFSGGGEPSPTYDDVRMQKTGHRETVKVIYDENTVDYANLVSVLLANTDPYDPDGQFVDRGRSYSLAVYYETQDEKTTAERLITSLERSSGRTVCVAVEPFKAFYPAEEYHQNYHKTHPEDFEIEMAVSGRGPTGN